jgi:solute carrier family 25 uncoupling protein 27
MYPLPSQVTHTVASICAGLAAALMGTPADVIKARIMNQPVDSAGRGLFYRLSLPPANLHE